LPTPEQSSLPRTHLLAFRALQAALLLAGLAIFVALFAAPALGLTLLWGILIPVAPALLVFAPGLWRNICPLATMGLLPRHLGLSGRRRLSAEAQGVLVVVGLVLLLALVPLRHLLLDVSGPVTGLALAVVGIAAIAAGSLYEWKSAWCSGLCPVYPVEVLYGTRPALTMPNAHCTSCQRCTGVCPDSTPAMHPLTARTSWGHALVGTIIVGGFPGFVWGWYQVPTRSPAPLWSHAMESYGMALGGLAATLVLFIILRSWIDRGRLDVLVRLFAAAAVSIYYWYRLPALIGFPTFPGEGVLVDLSTVLPAWTPMAAQIATTTLFVWWLVARPAARLSWTVRPPYAEGAARVEISVDGAQVEPAAV
jgi:hypothetical protein